MVSDKTYEPKKEQVRKRYRLLTHHMGSCPGNFDPDTCWDDVMRFDGVSQFAGNIDNASGIAINSDGGSISTDGSSFYGYSSIVEVVYSFSPDGTIVCPLNGDDCCRKGDPGCDY